MGNRNSSKKNSKSSDNKKPQDQIPPSTLGTNKDAHISSPIGDDDTTAPNEKEMEPSSWNELLGAKSKIFPPELDTIKTPPTDGTGIRDELAEILDDPANLDLIYKNYLEHYKKDEMRHSSTDVDPEADSMKKEEKPKEKGHRRKSKGAKFNKTKPKKTHKELQ